eukprot:gene19948-20459_t
MDITLTRDVDWPSVRRGDLEPDGREDGDRRLIGAPRPSTRPSSLGPNRYILINIALTIRGAKSRLTEDGMRPTHRDAEWRGRPWRISHVSTRHLDPIDVRPGLPMTPAQAATVNRVEITEAAAWVVARLKRQHGALLFHQSGGCCDGSAPMCYPAGEFRVGPQDVKLGEIAGCAFFMGAAQFDYWKHTQLIIDVVPGRGSGFSVEAPEGIRFLTRSRLFTEHEIDALEAAGPPDRGG